MSAKISVFVDSNDLLESVARKIVEILGAEFEPSNDRDYPFVFRVGAASLMCFLGYNEYELPSLSQYQQKYRFELMVRPIGFFEEGWEEAMIVAAHYVFEKLKASGQFPVMAVFNLEEHLGEFIPDNDQSQAERDRD